jgi:hypothetical protein
MLQTKFVEENKAHILCPTTLCENRDFYEIMGINIAEGSGAGYR